MEFPSMTKGSRQGQARVSSVPTRRPREATVWSCEFRAWIALETPGCWRQQSYGTLLGRAAKGGTSPKGRSVFQLKELDGAGDLKNILTSDMEIQSGVCPAGLQSCFGPVSPYYALFPMFWDGHVSPVPFLCGECAICYLTLTLEGLQ